MKNKISDFIKKYWICFKLCLIMNVGMIISSVFSNLFEIGGNNIRFNLADLYILDVIPIFQFAYGYITYKNTKKILIPNGIVIMTWFVFNWILSLITLDFSVLRPIGILFSSLLPTAYSMAGTLITAFIFKIKKTF